MYNVHCTFSVCVVTYIYVYIDRYIYENTYSEGEYMTCNAVHEHV